MDEVIFQGTARRRALNFAEVALLFSNEEGRVAIPQSEIEVARKTFREGGSEYSLNRESCRLRDIHNLLRGTGLGSNAYSVIEATMVETLLSDRAEERRSLFEEAAGIGRYKDSRVATTRRLESAEADLARLGDLIAEVENQVRALARQRRRAQRLTELRARRLQLEVALALHELAGLEAELSDAATRIAELEGAGSAARATRAAAEDEIAGVRAEQAELAARRAVHAEHLDVLRNRMHQREREGALAEERRANAELRMSQLVREAAELEARHASLGAEAARLVDDRAAGRERLAVAREQARASAEASGELRATLASERGRADSASSSLRQLARDLAAAEGERDALRGRAREAAVQRDRLGAQLAALDAELTRIDAEPAMDAERLGELERRAGETTARAVAAAAELEAVRGSEAAARDAFRAAEERAGTLAARLGAREAVERGYDGFAPAVAAVMADRARFGGVHGPLADFVDQGALPSVGLAVVESALGPLLHALVVDDLAAARAVRRWFREEWRGGGGLLMLPLDAPSLRAVGATTGGSGKDGGAAWVAALLDDVVDAADDDVLSTFPARGTRVAAAGEVLDSRGVVTIAPPAGGGGILARREALAALRAEHTSAAAGQAAMRDARDALLERVRDAERAAEQRETERRTAGAEAARARDEHALSARRRERLARERAAMTAEAARQEQAARERDARAAELEQHVAALRSALAAVEADATAERERLAALEARLEQARDQDAERRIDLARAEATLQETDRRHAAAAMGADAAAVRLAAIRAEAESLRETLNSVAGLRERAAEDARRIAADRDAEAAAIARLDIRLAELGSVLAAAEERGRCALAESEAAGEERHRLELRAAEARSSAARLREVLEAEWGRPWEALVAEAETPEDGGRDAWDAELGGVVAAIEAVGPVNMLAVEEHEEERRRLEFLLDQQQDLVASRDDLLAAIRQINRTAREVFVATFGTIRENFQRTFHALFEGGECDVRLADEDDPLESPIEIQASPRGKKTQRIHLLSGGERTLTALALLFAIYLVKPSPFCLLDEVDAPLDESNVGRFIHLLQEFKSDTQFVVITHNTRTMEAADWVYGITMEEAGVSSVVSVELEGSLPEAGRVA
jgi:chromosome segregation protein